MLLLRPRACEDAVRAKAIKYRRVEWPLTVGALNHACMRSKD